MIDLGLLREHPQKFVAEILKKDPAFNAEELVLLDQTVRILKQAVEVDSLPASVVVGGDPASENGGNGQTFRMDSLGQPSNGSELFPARRC